jgi:hypothetical protein
MRMSSWRDCPRRRRALLGRCLVRDFSLLCWSLRSSLRGSWGGAFGGGGDGSEDGLWRRTMGFGELARSL